MSEASKGFARVMALAIDQYKDQHPEADLLDVCNALSFLCDKMTAILMREKDSHSSAWLQ